MRTPPPRPVNTDLLLSSPSDQFGAYDGTDGWVLVIRSSRGGRRHRVSRRDDDGCDHQPSGDDPPSAQPGQRFSCDDQTGLPKLSGEHLGVRFEGQRRVLEPEPVTDYKIQWLTQPLAEFQELLHAVTNGRRTTLEW